MVNSIKRLGLKRSIGIIIEIISFIGCCFNIEPFKYWFYIGSGINILGLVFFIDQWGKEGKTWYKDLDKKRDKNLTRKSSELIFFISIAQVMIFSLVFIAEFWIRDFSMQFETIMGLFIMSMVCLIIVLIIVERTHREVEMLIAHREKKSDRSDRKK